MTRRALQPLKSGPTGVQSRAKRAAKPAANGPLRYSQPDTWVCTDWQLHWRSLKGCLCVENMFRHKKALHLISGQRQISLKDPFRSQPMRMANQSVPIGLSRIYSNESLLRAALNMPCRECLRNARVAAVVSRCCEPFVAAPQVPFGEAQVRQPDTTVDRDPGLNPLGWGNIVVPRLCAGKLSQAARLDPTMLREPAQSPQ